MLNPQDVPRRSTTTQTVQTADGTLPEFSWYRAQGCRHPEAVTSRTFDRSAAPRGGPTAIYEVKICTACGSALKNNKVK